MKIGFLSGDRIVGTHDSPETIPNLEEYQYAEIPADFQFKPGFIAKFVDGAVVHEEIPVEEPVATDEQVTMALVLDLYSALEAKGVI